MGPPSRLATMRALVLWVLAACVNCQVPTRLDMPLLRSVSAALNKNQAVSPFLVTDLLTQIWIGAESSTRDEIGQATGATSLDQLSAAYPAATHALSQASPEATTAVFSRIYVKKDFTVKPTFLQYLKNIYASDVSLFDKVPEAVTQINTDVANMTRGRISELVDNEAFSQAQLLIVSALYFKGSWQEPFKMIESDTFLTIVDSKTFPITVPMMNVHTKMGYAAFHDFDAASLPYKHQNYSLLLLRPPLEMSKIVSFHDKINLLNIGSIHSQIAGSIFIVNLTMPKFKIESSYKMKLMLSELGMKQVFTEQADLRGISSEPILVSEFVHKVFMDVNEEGTEAAGVAAATLEARTGLTEVVEEKIFKVDRPFLVVLYHKTLNLNLFSAWVANPTTEAGSQKKQES